MPNDSSVRTKTPTHTASEDTQSDVLVWNGVAAEAMSPGHCNSVPRSRWNPRSLIHSLTFPRVSNTLSGPVQ